MRPCVFLDRDGTLLDEGGYIDRVERIRMLPFAIDAVRLLNRAGFLAVVVSNQAGIAHGHFTEDFLGQVHGLLASRFAAGGARIDAFYYCPHLADARVEAYRQACDCRKPKPGLILRAAGEMGIDLARSYMIGDQWADVGAGRAAGVFTILVRTGYGPTVEAQPRDGVRPDEATDNLMSAVSLILGRERAGRLPRA